MRAGKMPAKGSGAVPDNLFAFLYQVISLLLALGSAILNLVEIGVFAKPESSLKV